MIGSFKNPNDEKKQMDKYLERLRLKQKLVKTQEMINKEVYSSIGVQKPSVVPEMKYQNIQQELSDTTLQLQKAQKNLRSFFKYPQDGNAALDLILQSYSAAQLNQFLPEFSTELKGVKDLTPSYFANQFDRFMTIKKSRGDNLVQIGINDNRSKIETLQRVAGIIGFISSSDAYKSLSGGQKKLLKERLESDTEPVMNPITGEQDKEKSEERFKRLLQAEELINKSKILTEGEQNKIIDEVDNRSKEWVRQEKEDREEKGLPDVPISIPGSTRSMFYKEAESEILNDKRELISDQIINFVIGESIQRGREVKEKLKERFQRKQEERKAQQEESQEKISEEISANIGNLRARKSVYDDYVASLEEKNQRIEDQKELKEQIIEYFRGLENNLGLKVNYVTGTIKIPKERLEDTKRFVIDNIMRGRDYENLSKKEKQEISVISRSNTDQVASKFNKILKPKLKRDNYFSKEKELYEIPTFEEYLEMSEESRKGALVPVRQIGRPKVPLEFPSEEELKGEEFQVEEIPPIRRTGRPQLLMEFPSGKRGLKPTPMMTYDDMVRVTKVLGYSVKDISGNPRYGMTPEEAEMYEPYIEIIDPNQIKELYKRSSIPNKIKKPTKDDIPGIRKDLIVHLREQAKKLSQFGGEGLRKKMKYKTTKVKQYGGFMEAILPILGNPISKPKKVVEPSMMSEVKPKRGRPKKVVEPTDIYEVKPKRGRPKKVSSEESEKEMTKKKHNKINIIKINK